MFWWRRALKIFFRDKQILFSCVCARFLHGGCLITAMHPIHWSPSCLETGAKLVQGDCFHSQKVSWHILHSAFQTIHSEERWERPEIRKAAESRWPMSKVLLVVRSAITDGYRAKYICGNATCLMLSFKNVQTFLSTYCGWRGCRLSGSLISEGIVVF